MSDQVNNLSGRASLDTTDYKAGVGELNRQIKVIESGFRATAATMQGWDKTAAGLEARNQSLSQVLDLQKQKVSALWGEYRKIVAEKGEHSRAAEEMKTKINKETEALNKSDTELRSNEKALQENASGVKKLGEEQKETSNKTDSLKEKMGGLTAALGVVAKGLVAVAAAAATAIAAVAGGVVKMAGVADDIAESAEKAGISVEKYQELQYIGKQLGTDINTMTGSFQKLIKAQDGSASGSGAQFDAFKKLKVNAVDPLTGSLRDSQTVYWETLEALAAWPNATERDAMAMTLLGKSADELKPLLNADKEELAAMTDQAHAMGAIMSDKAVNGLADFNDMLDSLKSGIQGVAGEVAYALLPMFSGIANGLQGYLVQLKDVVVGSNGDLTKMASGLGGLLGKILGDLGKNLPDMLKTGLGIVQGIVDAIITSLPELIPAVMGILNSLIEFILTNIPVLFDAAVQILLGLVNGIANSLPTLIPAIVKVLQYLVNTILINIPFLISAGLQIILGLIEGIIGSLPILLEMVPQIISELVTALISVLPMLLAASAQLVLMLALGIIENIPTLLAMTPKLAIAIVEQFKSAAFKAQWKAAAKAMVDGFASGWKETWENFKKNIVKNFQDVIDSIKKMLGIASPSKIFAGIGMMLPLGMQQGWNSQFTQLKRTMTDSMSELYKISAGGFGGQQMQYAGGQVSNNSENYAFYAPVVLQGGSGQTLANQIAKRY